MTVITHIEDLRVLAERRVPRMFYDYADSGSWTEGTYRANESEFQKIRLRQRVAVPMDNRSTATRMAGMDVAGNREGWRSRPHLRMLVTLRRLGARMAMARVQAASSRSAE